MTKIGNVRRLIRTVLSAAGGGVLFLLVFFSVDLPHGPEHWSADLRALWLSERLAKQHERIVLVEITNDTLAGYPYTSPVDRKLLADLIRTIDATAPKAIGLDFVFDRGTETRKDGELLQAIREAHAPIVLGALDENALPSADRDYQADFLARAARPGVRISHLYLGEERTNPVVVSEHVIRKIAMPSETEPDRLSFAEVLAQIDGRHEVDEGRQIAWLLRPCEARVCYWPAESGSGLETFLTLPADQVLAHDKNDLTLEPLFRDKFVLIGGNFPDRDQHLTPLSVARDKRFGGLVIHAYILAQLLADRHIYELGNSTLAILMLVAGILGIWTGRRKQFGLHELWVEFASVLVLVLVSFLMFVYGHFIFPFVRVFVIWLAGIAAGHFSLPKHESATHRGDR